MKINKIKYSPMWSDSLLTPKAKSLDPHDFTSQTTEASVASDT